MVMKYYKMNTLLLVILSLLPINLLAAEGSADETLDAVAKVMVGVTLALILLVIWLIVVYSEKNDSEGKIFFAPLQKIRKRAINIKFIERQFYF